MHVHSIIAMKGNGPLEQEHDGVVEYKSAYIDGTDSTRVIHSVQATPEGIEEGLRILEVHVSN